MPRKKRKEAPPVQVPGNPVVIKGIKQFIGLDGENLTNIRIQIDRLAMFLIQETGRQFSVTKFERMIKAELEKKMIGKVMNEKLMEVICKYIDKLSIYLTNEMKNAKRGGNPKVPGSD